MNTLLKYNPTLKQGSVNLSRTELVQGGRALYLEMDPNSFNYAKNKDYKLSFLLMDVDCQVARARIY